MADSELDCISTTNGREPAGSSVLGLWVRLPSPLEINPGLTFSAERRIPRQHCARGSQLSPLAQLPVRQVRENIPQDLRGGPAAKKLPARAGDTCIFLLQEGPTCLGATKPVHLEPTLCNAESHSWGSPPTAVKSSPPNPRAETRESLSAVTRTQHGPR